MGKAFRQVTDNPEKAEVITLEWASKSAIDYLEQSKSYIESCRLSDNQMERDAYATSALDAIGHIVILCQMVGALATPEFLTKAIFGEEIPVEIVEWDPHMYEEKE